MIEIKDNMEDLSSWDFVEYMMYYKYGEKEEEENDQVSCKQRNNLMNHSNRGGFFMDNNYF